MLDGVVDQAGPGALAARWRRTCRRPGFGVLQSDKGWSPALEHATVPVSADSHSDRRRPVVRIEDLVLAQWGWQDPGCWLLTLQTRTGQGCAQHTPPTRALPDLCGPQPRRHGTQAAAPPGAGPDCRCTGRPDAPRNERYRRPECRSARRPAQTRDERGANPRGDPCKSANFGTTTQVWSDGKSCPL